MMVMVEGNTTFEPIQVMCEVNGFMIPAIIDTGAEISVMSTSCAKRCHLSGQIDTQHSGRAIGVGSSEIVGGIEGLGLRIGPLSFQNKVSILRNSHSRCDFIIGLDVLRRFQCDLSLRDRVLKLHVRGNEVRIPLLSSSIGTSNRIKEEEMEQQYQSPKNSWLERRGGAYDRRPSSLLDDAATSLRRSEQQFDGDRPTTKTTASLNKDIVEDAMNDSNSDDSEGSDFNDDDDYDPFEYASYESVNMEGV